MRLPRYIKARTVTSELQSQRAAAITPQEAANVEMAKFGALASVADATAKVLDVEGQARAEEEYADAVFDYEDRMVYEDARQASRGYEVGEDGNVVLDDTQMLEEELEARRNAQESVLDRVSSGRAREKLNEYFHRSNQVRNTEYQTRAVERRIKVMGAQANHKVDTLIIGGNFDGAYDRAKLAVENGVMSQDTFNNYKLKINEKRTTSMIDNALMGETDRGELATMLTALDEGKWPGGKDLGINTETAYMYTNRINAKLANLDDAANAAVEAEREDQYLKLLVPTVNGEMGVDEIRTYRNVLDKDRFDKLVGYAITATRRPRESDTDVLETYERRVIELRIGRGYDPTYSGYKDTIDDVIHAMTMDPGMATGDINRLITDLDSYVKAINDDDSLEDILNVEIAKITGRKVDQFQVMFEGQDRSHIVEAQRLERDFKRAMLQAGPKDVVFNGEQWMAENVGKYHIRVQKKMLNDYGILEAPTLPGGEIDSDKLGATMLKYKLDQAKSNETGQGQTESQARQQAEFDFNTYMRLIGAG